ncbi:hypothetical protein CIP107549_02047 [Corynebacterium diphtheriae]|nr:hypothetical protein CIP107549_02047 [Corynebacterium diphtheriae]
MERPLLELKIRQLFERALESKVPLPMGYFSTVVNTKNGWFGWVARRTSSQGDMTVATRHLTSLFLYYAKAKQSVVISRSVR